MKFISKLIAVLSKKQKRGEAFLSKKSSSEENFKYK